MPLCLFFFPWVLNFNSDDLEVLYAIYVGLYYEASHYHYLKLFGEKIFGIF